MAQVSWLSSFAQRCCTFFERWFPDAFAFAVLAVAVVTIGALSIGAPPILIAQNFGSGFWSLIPFTMQMAFIIIGGYVVADSPPVARLVMRLASQPKTSRGGIALIAFVSIACAFVHWGMSTVLAGLLARRMNERTDVRFDYRASGAAACIGMGTVWALGLSSSAAQLQANPGSMPAALLTVSGVIPFAETIFLWQSLLIAGVLAIVGVWVAWRSAPEGAQIRTAKDLQIEPTPPPQALPPRSRPGEWLEYSPLITVFVALLAVVWLVTEISAKGFQSTISNLNAYNFIFIIAGLVLQWRPRRFVESVARSVPSVAGVLLQFPFIGSVAAILTNAKNSGGVSLTDSLSGIFTHAVSHATFAPLIGAYSALLGLFVPSGGGKWIIEGPYVMQAANALQYHLGWVVQIYNAGEALPNLINPFWMLPMLGILRLKARDVIGFTFVQFLINLPLVLGLLWLLGATLTYHPPVRP